MGVLLRQILGKQSCIIAMLLEAPKLAVTSGKLAEEGYTPYGYGIAYWGECKEYFSDAHDILSQFLWRPGKYDYSNSFKMISDGDATIYPEVYQAWKAAGQDDNIQMVGIIPEAKVWAVGFGGKKNAERACKLAMALSMAEIDPEMANKLSMQYPNFRELLGSAGGQTPSGGMSALFRSSP